MCWSKIIVSAIHDTSQAIIAILVPRINKAIRHYIKEKYIKKEKYLKN